MDIYIGTVLNRFGQSWTGSLGESWSDSLEEIRTDSDSLGVLNKFIGGDK